MNLIFGVGQIWEELPAGVLGYDHAWDKVVIQKVVQHPDMVTVDLLLLDGSIGFAWGSFLLKYYRQI